MADIPNIFKQKKQLQFGRQFQPQRLINNNYQPWQQYLVDPKAQVFINDLDSHITEDMLRIPFKPFGQIHDIKIQKDSNGRSKGYGFITFKNIEDANSARLQLNHEKILDFQPIRVTKIYTKEEWRKIKNNIIFISNIPPQVNEKSLDSFFSQYGTIASMNVKQNDKEKLGYGYLAFEKDENLKRLMTKYENKKNRNNFTLFGQYISITQINNNKNCDNKNNNLYLNNYDQIDDQENFSNLTKNSLEYMNLNQCYQLKKSVQKVEILNNKINFPYVVQPPIYQPKLTSEQKQSDLNTKIMVSKLDPGLTEEMLWSCFKKFGPIVGLKICKNSFGKSMGFGFIQFKNIYSANSAILEMNHKRILNFKSITVSIVYTEEELRMIKKNQIVISNIPPYKNEISLYKIFNHFSIISLKIEQDDKTKLNNCYIIFEKQQDVELIMHNIMMISDNNYNKDFEYFYDLQGQGQNIYINQFKDIKKGDLANNKLLIKNFAQLNDLEQHKINNLYEMEQNWQEELKHLPELHGNESVCVKTDSYLNKPYAIVTFKNSCNIQQIIDQLQQKGIDSFQLYNKIRSNPVILDNLSPEVDIILLEQQIEQYGVVQDIVIDSQQAIIYFNEEDDAMKFLSTHSWNKNLNQFFVDGKVQKITICLSSDYKKEFISQCKTKRNSTINNPNKSNLQINQQLIQSQKFQYQPLTQYQNITLQDIKNNLSAFLAQSNFIQRQQLIKIMFPKVQQHLNKDQVQHTPKITDMLIDFSVFDVSDIIELLKNGQKLINNVQEAEKQIKFKILIKEIKNNIPAFLAKSIDIQRQQLIQLIFPRVLQHLDKEKVQNAPIITGMLIDFSVFEVSDIIEFLENDAELKEQVKEAEYLIKDHIFLNEIKNNLPAFLAKPIDDQKQFLGFLIFPKVCQHLDIDELQNAPKITGMLIDFSVFKVSDIIEFLENDAKLQQRVLEGSNIIRSQLNSVQSKICESTQQSPLPQTLNNPEFQMPFPQRYNNSRIPRQQQPRPNQGFMPYQQRMPNRNPIMNRPYNQNQGQQFRPQGMQTYGMNQQPQQQMLINQQLNQGQQFSGQPPVIMQNAQINPNAQNVLPQGAQLNSQLVKQVQPQNPTISFEDIKNNLSAFLAKSIDLQRQQLGQLIFPRVQQHLDKDQVQNAPKITGMLIDFSVFEVSDIIEFLENDAELKERVLEAQKIIQSQTNN